MEGMEIEGIGVGFEMMTLTSRDGGDSGGGVPAAASLIGSKEVGCEEKEGDERVKIESSREEMVFGGFRSWVVGFHIGL